MGRSYIPKYRVEYQDNINPRTTQSMCWGGRATATRLAAWRDSMNASFAKPGRSNWHVSEAAGVVVHIWRAALINQHTGRVVAEVKAPAFELVE